MYKKAKKERILKFGHDKALAHLIEQNRTRISRIHSGKPALTNKLIAKIAMRGFMLKDEEHFFGLVDKYENFKETVSIDSPSVDRVKIDHDEYCRLYDLSARLLAVYSISITVPNLYRLAQMEINDATEIDLRNWLEIHLLVMSAESN